MFAEFWFSRQWTRLDLNFKLRLSEINSSSHLCSVLSAFSCCFSVATLTASLNTTKFKAQTRVEGLSLPVAPFSLGFLPSRSSPREPNTPFLWLCACETVVFLWSSWSHAKQAAEQVTFRTFFFSLKEQLPYCFWLPLVSLWYFQRLFSYIGLDEALLSAGGSVWSKLLCHQWEPFMCFSAPIVMWGGERHRLHF